MTIWTPDLAGHPGPLYIALADALAADLRNGRLAPGTRLPTHRELADRLGVTVGTVSRGYAEAARRGLLSGEVGRGTFTRESSRTPPLEALAAGETPVIDLSLNHPAVLPFEPEGAALQATLAALAARPGLSDLLVYQPEGGAASHRAAGAAWIGRTGLEARPEQVLLCNGSQHAMTTVFSALVQPGDLVLTEALTYPGMKSLANLLHLRLQGVALDAHGLRPDALEAACRGGRAKALYCIPTIQNPTASVMPEARRQEISAIARAHDLWIVEDDIHGLLPASAPRPLSAFAPELSYYITSTSKSIAPGLRIGYVLAPPRMIDRLSATIRTITWMVAPLMAEIASIWIQDGTADRLLEARRQEAASRQRLARELLGRWEYQAHPTGYHLWLQLPDPWRSETFVAQARERGVAVTPAEAFVVGRESTPHAVRICIGAARSLPELELGLRSLAEMLESPPRPQLSFV